MAPSSAVSARFDGMEAPDAGRVELRVAGRECLVANYGNATGRLGRDIAAASVGLHDAVYSYSADRQPPVQLFCPPAVTLS